ncbi:MAG TPA: hypothetical protein VGM90_11485 [Kofleriaceae bacterium]|jgi:hypothetical protein
MPVDLSVGAVVVLDDRGGLATVLRHWVWNGTPYVDLAVAMGGTFSLALTRLEQGGARAVIDRDEAMRRIDVLRDLTIVADERPFRVRAKEHMQVLGSGTDDDLLRSLRMLYASRYALTPTGRELIGLFEGPLLPEIAFVLGVDLAQLTSDLHAGHSAFSSTVTREDELRRRVGSFFHVNDLLSVGDPFVAERWQGRAARGRWTVFVEYNPVYAGMSAFVAVHQDALSREDELRAGLRRVETLFISHNTIAFFDADAQASLEHEAAAAWLRLGPDPDDNLSSVDSSLLHYCGAGVLTSNGTKRTGIAEENGLVVLVLVAELLEKFPGLEDEPVDH